MKRWQRTQRLHPGGCMTQDQQTTVEHDNTTPQRWSTIIRRGVFRAAVLLLLAIAVCEWWQPDRFAAVTAIPPWCWFVACFAIGSVGFTCANRLARIGGVVVLLGFLGLSVEQSRSLARSMADLLSQRHEVGTGAALRVVSINCAGGSPSAAKEAFSFSPDVVFLQESPNEQVVRELATTLFGTEGSVAWSPDCSIIARGQLQPSSNQTPVSMAATLTLPDGKQVELVCLRLSPPVVRYDLWSPGAWSEHAASRRKHRDETTAIANALTAISTQRPILMGGDCNSPAGDGALQAWSMLGIRDAFQDAGRGWGDTVLNQFPVLRFDQLWSSDEVAPLAVWAVRTDYSDHRMVVGDFLLSDRQVN
jgi:vancomycin resistance protein VanJ